MLRKIVCLQQYTEELDLGNSSAVCVASLSVRKSGVRNCVVLLYLLSRANLCGRG